MYSRHSPFFLQNSLFLYFSLWLLKEGKTELKLKDSDSVYNVLVSYVRDRIDLVQLNLVDVASLYPAFDLSRICKLNDKLGLQFVKDVMGKCKKIRELSFTTEHAVEEILRAMEFSKIREIRVIDHITKIYAEMLEGVEVVRSVENKTENISNGYCGPDVSVIMNYNASASFEALLDFLRDSNRSFSLRLIVKSQDVMIDVSDLIKGKIVQLHFSQPSFLFAEKTIETCQHLTHLAFTNLVKFKEDVFTTLCGAVTSEKLPKVKYLTFYSCRDSIKGKLGMLFKKPWPTLTHLNVGDCCLNEEDTKIICAAAQNAQKNNLPELRSLILMPNYLEISNDIRLFERPWEKLSSLILMTAFLPSSEEGVGYKSFLGALKQGIFPNLVNWGRHNGQLIFSAS